MKKGKSTDRYSLKLYNFLQQSLQKQTMISTAVLCASLFSTNAVADQQLWLNGSAFDPAKHIARNLPIPSSALDEDKWLQSGDAKLRNQQGVEITDFAQYQELLGENNKLIFIDQTSGKVILNWESFDINQGYTVEFKQPKETSIALNQISESMSPSYILGNLKSNGGVYLINPNGVIFGKDSRVNVGSLMASTLDIDENSFLQRPIGEVQKDLDKAAFSWNGVDGADGKLLQFDAEGNLTLSNADVAKPERGDIAIQKGAEISTTNLNGVVMVAPDLMNAGKISTPNGQTLLAAAKDQAYVLFSNDPNLRGLLIELKTGGNLTNLGEIIAERGNVTLAGLLVNHEGSIRATTSVDFNGSVRLVARDGATKIRPTEMVSGDERLSNLLDETSTAVVDKNGLGNFYISSHGGKVNLRANASIDISPDQSVAVAPDAQTQRLSGVEISASEILLEDNSSIKAKGGEIYLDAINNISTAYSIDNNKLSFQFLPPLDADGNPAQINIDSGVTLDVSGTSTQLEMSRNQIQIELRSNELADAPLQRLDDSFLKGKKVVVDIRQGTPLADIEPALATVPKTIDERLTEGGKVRLRSEGDVIVKPQASIDISGGVIHYNAGYLNTTKLLADGKLIDIADADPNQQYDGILGGVTSTNKRFNITREHQNFFIDINRGKFVDAFDQGANAGSLLIQAQAAFFQADVNADALVGVNQREASVLPLKGSLEFDLKSQSILIDQLTVPVDLPTGSLLTRIENSFTAEPLIINAEMLNSSDAGLIKFTSRLGKIELTENTSLMLQPKTQLSLRAADQIVIEGDINTPGGNINIETSQLDLAPSININRSILLGENSQLSTSGNWTNDNPILAGNEVQSNSVLVVDGGAISFKAAGDLILSEGSSLNANAGGWLDTTGKLHQGKGGNIALSAVQLDDPNTPSIQTAATLFLGAELSSYAFLQGGSLSITAPSIYIGENQKDPIKLPEQTLVITPDFFQEGGFSQYQLKASASKDWVSEFYVATGNEIQLNAKNYQFYQSNTDEFLVDNSLSYLATGSDLKNHLGVTTLPEYRRQAVDLFLALDDKSAERFHLTNGFRSNHFIFDKGSLINANAQSRIDIQSNTYLVFDGVVKAKGGELNLLVNNNFNSFPVDLSNYDDLGVWIGSNAYIDLSAGFIRGLPTNDGLTQVGKVIDAGHFSASTNRGFVISDVGSSINLSGAEFVLERWQNQEDAVGAELVTYSHFANAGSFNIKVAEGAILAGEIDATASGTGAGGQFSLTMTTPVTPSISEGSPLSNFDFSTISFDDRKIVLNQNVDYAGLMVDLSLNEFGKTNSISESMNATTELDVNQLMAAGFDTYQLSTLFTERPSALQLQSFTDALKRHEAETASGIGKILLVEDLIFVAKNSIALNTTSLVADSGRSIITAPHIRLGFSNGNLEPDALNEFNADKPRQGSGNLFLLATNFAETESLNFQQPESLVSFVEDFSDEELLTSLNQTQAGGLLEIKGKVSISGTDKATLASAGDIRTQGYLFGEGQGDSGRYLGNLSVYKDLILQADQIYPTTLTEFIFASGQRDFSTIGSITAPISGSSVKWSLVNTHSLEFEYTDPITGETKRETTAPTIYEAYDLLNGQLGKGSKFYRKVGSSELLVEGSLVAITETAVMGDAAGKIQIREGSGSTPVLSAAGQLIFDAPEIEQSGVVKAPFGQIIFNSRITSAANSGKVVFKEGSLTSVSAEKTVIPFGEIDSSGSLIYRVNPQNSEDKSQRLFTESPHAGVMINAEKIDLQSGSEIDLSGGGDLQAFRFIPGPGGSKDVLAPANTGDAFALIPGTASDYAAFDPFIYFQPDQTSTTTSSFAQPVGKTIYLENNKYLPAGEYTLLPARYASLPGALLVTPTHDGKIYTEGQNLRRVDGASIVAGRFATANTSQQDSVMSGFIIEPGSIAKTRSEYLIGLSSELFAATANSSGRKSHPDDAGSLTLIANKSLNINSDINALVGKSGLGSELNVVSDQLSVVNQFSIQNLSGQNLSNQVELLASQLSADKFNSVLLGGRRSRDESGVSIIAESQSVTIDDSVNLALPELILIAKGNEQEDAQVNIGKLAKISAVSNSKAPTEKTSVVFLGDSLIRLSTQSQWNVNQQSDTKGHINIESGAVTEASGAQMFISNGKTLLDGDIKMTSGSLSLGAEKISIGDVDESVTGLKFTAEDLNNLTVDELILNSSTSLDFYGSTAVSVKNLVLKAGAILGLNQEHQSTSVTAQDNLTIIGFESSLVSVDNNIKNLTDINFSAKNIVLGEDNWLLQGFNRVKFNASAAVIGEGASQLTLVGNQSLNIETPVLTAKGGANTQVLSDGDLSVSSIGEYSTAVTGLGAKINLAAKSISYAANTYLPSGELSLQATGQQGENLDIKSNSVINLAGTSVLFDRYTIASDAGKLNLQSYSGDVVANQGALIDLSGVSGKAGSHAGKLSVEAPQGIFLSNANIKVNSGELKNGGSLSLLVQEITDFSQLISQINSSNFTNSLNIQTRSGNLLLKENESLHAREIVLTADKGDIAIAGDMTLTNSVEEKANLQISAKHNLHLQSTAKITANQLSPTDTRGSGKVMLSSAEGQLTFDQGSQIETQSGHVILRVPRLQNQATLVGNQAGNDVAINLPVDVKLNQLITHADRVDVNAVKIYQATRTSEIFNTDINGDSTISMGYSFLTYRSAVPFGAICNSAEGCSLIKSTSFNSFGFNVEYVVVDDGDALPLGTVCGDESGCSYSFKWNDDQKSIANSETQSFMSNAKNIEERLWKDFSVDDAFHLQPELEINSTSDLIVDEEIDFAKGLGVLQLDQNKTGMEDHDSIASLWRFNDKLIQEYLVSTSAYVDRYAHGEAGVLSLRAQGDIKIQAPINDGFVDTYSLELLSRSDTSVRKELSNDQQGWSYNLVAGADMNAANPFDVNATSSVVLGKQIGLVTSLGDIQLIAGGDVRLQESSRIFTAGRPTSGSYYEKRAGEGFNFFELFGTSYGVYGENGGDITIRSSGNIEALGQQQFVTDWLHRIAKDDVTTSRFQEVYEDGLLPTTWVVSPDNFKQGIATLGGGDIQISAAGAITNLSVALPTTGKNISEIAPTENETYQQYLDNLNKNIQVIGGGNLNMSAGGNIDSAQIMIGKGQAYVRSGGSIGSEADTATLLELMDGNISLSAAVDIHLANIINPTMGRISSTQIGTEFYSESFFDLGLAGFNNTNYFFTYAADAGVQLNTLAGNVIFSDSNQISLRPNESPFVINASQSLTDFTVFAPRLRVAALQGDIRFDSTNIINLYPSSQGQLSLLAGKNILSNSGSALHIPDVDPSSLVSILKPLEIIDTSTFLPIFNLSQPEQNAGKYNLMHATVPLYLSNTEEMKLVAASGDIRDMRLITPTFTNIYAGKDIVNITLEIQHTKAQDISSVTAGGNIIFSTPRAKFNNALDLNNSTQGIDIAGMGRLDIFAAGNVELGASRGVQSIGTANNPNLLRNGFAEEAGADISIFAGIKKPMNIAGFVDQYFTEYKALDSFTTSQELITVLNNFQSSDRDEVITFIKQVSAITQQDYYSGVKSANLTNEQLQQTLISVKSSISNLDLVSQQQIAFHVINSRLDNYTGDLVAFVTSEKMGSYRLDASNLMDLSLEQQHAQSIAAFKNAPESIKRELILQTYFNEIRQGGIADISGDIENPETDGFARSYAAIESLFPGASTEELKPEDYSGDISLIFSTVQTQQGGDINLLAPGGSIDVGVAAVGGGVSKDSSKLGLIALRNGQVNAAVFDNINVNSSRVFALDGGDITLWSSYGNLDAGRGAKTALSVPPPIINSDGSVNFQAAVAGSGIRNSRFTENRAPGAVYLFAPDGVVNAGDAGIGSQGDVLIAAQQVIGADNIDVGGISVGIPVATGVSANLAGAAAAAGAATDSTTDELLEKDMEENVDQRRPAFVTIDILGMDF